MSEGLKSGSASPTKSVSTRKSVNSSPINKQAKPSFQSPAAAKNKNKTYASLAKAKSNTIAFDKPTTVRKDITIYHEDKIMLSLITSEKKTPVRRDPILQNNNEPVEKFKPSYRPVSAERNASRKEDDRVRAKRKGEYNHVYNPRPEEPKPQGIKAFVVAPPQSADENPRRLSRGVRHKSEIRQRNPMLDGETSVERRVRRPGTPTDDHQRMNEKKYLLPSERSASPSGRGRVFRESSINLGEMNYSSVGAEADRYTSARPLSAMEEKVRGSIKGVLEYESGPSYRDHIITDKAQTVKFLDLLRAQDRVSRVFSRKKTLEY